METFTHSLTTVVKVSIYIHTYRHFHIHIHVHKPTQTYVHTQTMSADGDVIDGVPVPLYIDLAKQKELEKARELAKKNGLSKEAFAKSTAHTVLSIISPKTLFGRTKVYHSTPCSGPLDSILQ